MAPLGHEITAHLSLAHRLRPISAFANNTARSLQRSLPLLEESRRRASLHAPAAAGRGHSSVGRAAGSQSAGQGFESPCLQS